MILAHANNLLNSLGNMNKGTVQPKIHVAQTWNDFVMIYSVPHSWDRDFRHYFGGNNNPSAISDEENSSLS